MAAPNKHSLPDATILAKTGKTRAEWHAILDEFECLRKGHQATARWLEDHHGVSPWWAQSLTIDYERAHGGREVGRRSHGRFEVNVTRTINAPTEVAWRAWTAPDELAKWDPGRLGEPRRAVPLERLLFGGGDLAAQSDVVVQFLPKPDGRTTVAVTHAPLPDKETCDAMREYWRARLTALKAYLERASNVRKG
jgi:uncharacterized protein YndB with AHSA1/START domain